MITTLLPIEGGNDKEYLLRSNCWIGAGKSLSWPVLIAQLLLLFAAFALGKVFFFCVGGLDLEIAAVDGRSHFCCSRCLLIFSPPPPPPHPFVFAASERTVLFCSIFFLPVLACCTVMTTMFNPPPDLLPLAPPRRLRCLSPPVSVCVRVELFGQHDDDEEGRLLVS